jgi:hypothetical protein
MKDECWHPECYMINKVRSDFFIFCGFGCVCKMDTDVVFFLDAVLECQGRDAEAEQFFNI